MYYENLLEMPLKSFLKLGKFLKVDLSKLDDFLNGKLSLRTSHEINGNRLLRNKNDNYFKRLNNQF